MLVKPFGFFASAMQAALNLHYPLVANIVNEMWEAACTVEENADRSDFKRKDLELAFPPITVTAFRTINRPWGGMM